MQVLSSKLKETNPIYAARNCVTDKNNLKRIKELIKELFHTATFVLIFFFFLPSIHWHQDHINMWLPYVCPPSAIFQLSYQLIVLYTAAIL